MKQSFVRKILSFILVLACYSSVWAIDTLNAGAPVLYDINDYCEWAHTDIDNSTLEEAEAILNAGGFAKIKNNNYSKNSIDKSLWLRTVFRNTAERSRNFLWAISREQVTVTAYERINGKYVKIDSVSSHTPYLKRPYPMYLLATELRTDTGVTRDIMLRLTPTDKGRIWIKQFFNTELHLRLSQINYVTYYVIYASFLFFLFIQNLIFAAIYKGWLFLWQATYVLLVFIFNGYEFHAIEALPTAVFSYMSNINKLAWLNAAGTAIVFVYIRKTALPLVSPSLYSFFIKCIYVYLACFWQMMLIQLLMPLFTDSNIAYKNIRYISLSLANYASEIIMVIVIIISVLIFPKVKTSTKIFIMAVLITIIAVFGYATNGFGGIIEDDWLHPQILILALVTEILLFSFISFYWVNKEHKEKAILLDHNLAFQKTLTQEVINAREADRKQIAQDLHDDIGGTLSALKMHISSPQMDKQRAFALISKAIADLRNISHNLLPPQKKQYVPFEAITEQINEINNAGVLYVNNGIEVPKTTFSITIEITVVRIVTELLTNILKHAKATEASVQIFDMGDILQIIVEDNGVGFDTQTPISGIGIRNVISRVDFLKGVINIDSNKNGTTIIIEIPLHKKEDPV